ncbi:MAG: hypothetical protein WA971_00940 [Microbacterium sp.]
MAVDLRDADRTSADTAHPSRRAVVTGAIWATPVIAAAVALPSASASESECAAGSATFTVPTLDSNAAGLHTWTVPAGVTSLTFTVIGGVGAAGSGPTIGLGANRFSPIGGAGAVAAGTLDVIPGEMLSLVVGQGGSTYPVDPAQTGGQGYGDGGSSTLTNTPYRVSHGGGGGGGSAILRGKTPLVVAAGGGGGGAGGYRNLSASFQTPSDGGPADRPSTSGRVLQLRSARTTTVSSVSGSTGGTGSGNRHAWADGHTASGRDGADGVQLNMPSHTVPDVSVISGGGGGGYSGGGSGGVAYYYHVPPEGYDYYEHAFISAGGAGGASYVASTVSATVTPRTDVTWEPRDVRRPGAIVLAWTC